LTPILLNPASLEAAYRAKRKASVTVMPTNVVSSLNHGSWVNQCC
jgi:hypothetical protein